MRRFDLLWLTIITSLNVPIELCPTRALVQASGADKIAPLRAYRKFGIAECIRHLLIALVLIRRFSGESRKL